MQRRYDVICSKVKVHTIFTWFDNLLIHGVFPRCKDFHLSDSRLTVSLMWYETPPIPMALFQT